MKEYIELVQEAGLLARGSSFIDFGPSPQANPYHLGEGRYGPEPETEEEIEARRIIFWLLQTWGRFHMPTLRLTPAFECALLLTDIGNVRLDSLQLPFPVMNIVLPTGSVLNDNGKHGHSIMYGTARIIRSPRYPSVDREQLPTQKDVDRFYELNEGRDFSDMMFARFDRGGGYTMLKTPLRRDVFSDFERRVGRSKKTECGSGVVRHDNFEDFDERPALLGVLHLMYALAEYMKTLPRHRPSPSSRVQLKRHELNGVAPANPAIWVLGKWQPVARPMRDAARLSAQRDKKPKQFTISKRFVVRGHIRNQACGERRRKRKMIWVKPYVKGPGLAEALVKLMEATG